MVDKGVTIDDLIQSGALSDAAARFLRACVLSRKNIVVSGGTGAGKTTLLNALASFIPATECITTIEEVSEIKLSHEHVISFQARSSYTQRERHIRIRQLFREALQTRPDRIILGDCRGGEVLDMIQAMKAGQRGSLMSIHASSVWDALPRLETLALMADDMDIPFQAIRDQMASSLNVVVQSTRLGNGSRQVVSVCEIVNQYEQDQRFIIEQIFQYGSGRLFFTGYIPTFMEELFQKCNFNLNELS